MGVSLFIVGAECLVVEQAVLVQKVEAAEPGGLLPQAAPAPTVVRPPEWVPWIFMSAGAVVVLYSFTIPRRVAA
jgi:hypothetical protein